ncbi:tetratricopeptide repeat protein [Streptomyces sp. NPDC007901]|uniref:tetratricopeptide repeat protein n=1 Tax=Streptomyces sp. NPDC007901 TaxID=3364785 RepID=UPI0036ECDBCD
MLFARGALGRTLAVEIIYDLTRFGESETEVLSDPLLREAIDDSLFAELLKDVDDMTAGGAPDRAISLASLVLDLAERNGSRMRDEIRLRLAGALLVAGRSGDAEEVVRHLAAEGGTEMWEIIGRACYDQGRYTEALTAFLEGFRHSDVPARQWDLLTSAVACHFAMGEHVPSLTLLTERVEPLALTVGEPRQLSKTYGDLGNAWMGLDMLELARASFSTALAAARSGDLVQDQSDWIGNLGNVAMSEGDAEAAAELHRQALELSHRTGNPHSLRMDLGNLASACEFLEQWDEALRCREEAVRVAEGQGDPQAVRAERSRLRDLRMRLGHWRKAVALDLLMDDEPEAGVRQRPHVRARLPDGPEFTDTEFAFVREVEAMVSVRELEAAHAVIDRFLVSHPASFAAHFELGLVLNESGAYEDSLVAYERALEINPRWVNLHRNMLNSWRALGDLDTPRQRYEQAVADDPFDPVPRIALGLLYGVLGRSDDAVRESREATRLDPDSRPTQGALCKVLAEASVTRLGDDWEGAWALVEETLSEFRRFADMDGSLRADALTQLGEFCHRVASESGMANPALLGGIIADRESCLLGHAVAAFTEAITLAPHRRRPMAGLQAALRLISIVHDVDAFIAYSRGLSDAGAADLATGALEYFINLHPEHPEALYQLGMLRIRSRDNLIQARDLFEAAARLDPGEPRYGGAVRHANSLLAEERL